MTNTLSSKYLEKVSALKLSILKMRKLNYLVLVFLLFIIAYYSFNNGALFFNSEKEELRKLSSTWNIAFATRDTSSLLKILADDVQMASAGGKWREPAGTDRFIKTLFERRPDITWVNDPSEIKVNSTWNVAYETGNWTEGWTEPDGKAVINGKYFVLWKQKNGSWFLQAAIFTPMSCTGPSQYCRKH